MSPRDAISPPRDAAPGALPGLGAAANQTEERQRALATLLQRPLLHAQGPHAAEFRLVRRHAEHLRQWFARYPNWSLSVDSEIARLRKIPADRADGTRPARSRTAGAPWSRRCYVLFCLALAALERADRQIVLGLLAERIRAMTADPVMQSTGFRFNLTSPDERQDLVQVVRLLLEMRVLIRIEGDEDQYLAERGDVLYNIHRPALAHVPSIIRSPSTIGETQPGERLAALLEEPIPDSEEGRNRRIRASLVRRLLDDPIVYYDELDEAERNYLNRQRGHLLPLIEEATGLVAEIRKEGIAMVDPSGDVTDLKMPEEGTDGHLALLLSEFLTARLRDGSVPVPRAAVEGEVAQLIVKHRSRWRKSVSEPGAERLLAEQALSRLEALRLLRIGTEGVQPLPAIARYAIATPADESAADDELR